MKRILMRFCSPVMLIALLGAMTAMSQEPREPVQGDFRLGAALGITTFALGDVRDLTEAVMAGYAAAGLPVEQARDYPPNLLAGVEFCYVGLSPWSLGLSASYTWTSAYGLYSDYAGTLDFHSKADLVSGYVVVQHSFSMSSTLQPFVDIRGGVAWASFLIEETVDASEYAGITVTSELSEDDLGFAGEASAGARYVFGSLALSGRAGYRYADIDVKGLGVDASGFLGVATLEWTF